MPVQAGTDLLRPSQTLPEHVTADSPATDSMTDLARVTAATIEPEASIARAEEHMRHAEVRLLFVMDAAHRLLGLVTLTDIKGERPLRAQRELGLAHGEVRVRDIMTPAERLETLSMHDVSAARVGDIVQTLKRTGRQHALVAERTIQGPVIRGIFSASRISRQLGVPVETTGIAYTFAELEAALSH
jgi:CBS domain containing-hemolysin-like protein